MSESASESNSDLLTATESMLDQPKKKKRKRTDLSHPAVIAEVITRKMAQQTNTQICNELQMAPQSVTKVLESADYSNLAKTYSQRAAELIPPAFDAVEFRLKHSKDGDLGRKYLIDMGVIGAESHKPGMQSTTILHQQIMNLVAPSTAISSGETSEKPAIDVTPVESTQPG